MEPTSLAWSKLARVWEIEVVELIPSKPSLVQTHRYSFTHSSLFQSQHRACLSHLYPGSPKVIPIILACWQPTPAMLVSYGFLMNQWEKQWGIRTVRQHRCEQSLALQASRDAYQASALVCLAFEHPFNVVPVETSGYDFPFNRSTVCSLLFPMTCRTEKIIASYSESVILCSRD